MSRAAPSIRACRCVPVLSPFGQRHAPGHLRNTFATISSLMPGTLPCGENEGEIIFHCLDVGQPVLEQLAAEEKVLARVLDEVPGDG